MYRIRNLLKKDLYKSSRPWLYVIENYIYTKKIRHCLPQLWKFKLSCLWQKLKLPFSLFMLNKKTLLFANHICKQRWQLRGKRHPGNSFVICFYCPFWELRHDGRSSMSHLVMLRKIKLQDIRRLCH